MKPLDDPLSRAYIEHLEAVRTPINTIIARHRVLRLVGNAGLATREEIEAWWLTRADRKKSTRANDLSCLRAFYKWAIRWEHRIDNPTARIDPPTVPNRVPRPMARPDLEKLLDKLAPDLRRAVCLGAYAGLRVSEAAALDWRDVDVAACIIRVLGKGEKTRLVAVDELTIADLTPEDGPRKGNVVTAGGKPMTGQNLDRRVNRAIHACGVEATFHMLRHLYGTVGYRETRDLRALAEQMGHSSVNTTAGYAKAADEAARAIASAVRR